MIKKIVKKFRRFITFGIVGCINTALDYLVFIFCREVLIISPAASQAIGYCSGVLCSFILNHGFTFHDRAGRNEMFWRQFAGFICVNLASLGISTALITLLTDAGMLDYLAKVLVTVVVMIINYFGYKRLVFKV
jgi:putative flippase GtrA